MDDNQKYSLIIVGLVAVVAVFLMLNTVGVSSNGITGDVVKQSKYGDTRLHFKDLIKQPGSMYGVDGTVATIWFSPGETLLNELRDNLYKIKALGYANGCNFEVSLMSEHGIDIVETKLVTLEQGEETEVFGMFMQVYAKRPVYTPRGEFDCQLRFNTQ